MNAPALAEATRLARAGRYDDARHVLDAVGGAEADEPGVLDLLARLHAQQGDLASADVCWARAERLSPGHAGAAAGRRRIRETWAGRRSGPRSGAVLAAALLFGGGAVAGWAAVPRLTPPDGVGPAETAALRAEAVDAREDVAGMRADIADLRAQLRPLVGTGGPGSPSSGVVDGLREPGVPDRDARWTVRRDHGVLEVTFRDATFLAGGAQPSDGGRAALVELGRQIERAGGDTSLDVDVLGHTSDTAPLPGSAYPDNASLGLARAQAAAELLAEGSGMPLGAFAVSSSADLAPPYPNTTHSGRTRNQTVTLQIEERPA